jgi:protein SCO1
VKNKNKVNNCELKTMRIIAILGSVFLFLVSCNQEEKLPYIGERDYEYANGEIVDTLFHQIPDFSYTNQNGQTLAKKDVLGQVFVADFFFSTCPTICPKMTSQMKRLQTLTSDIEEIRFLSFTINPKNDTPEVLLDYANQYGVSLSNWDFLTGDEDATHHLGVKGFLVHARADEDEPGGFAHSPSLVLVDRKGHIRGVYDGTSTEEVDQLNLDIRKLLRTEYGIRK